PSGASRDRTVSRSRRTSGSALSHRTSDALVCCRNTVQMPLRTPVAATARCTSLVTSSVPRPLVRKSSVCCPITSLLLESPYEIGARLAGLHQQREIRARQDQLHAHVDMPLQQLRRIHPAHARELAVLAAGGDNFGIRLAD